MCLSSRLPQKPLVFYVQPVEGCLWIRPRLPHQIGMARVMGSSDPKSGTCVQRTAVTSFLRRELQVWHLHTSLVHLSPTQWGAEHTGGGWALGGTAGAGRAEADLEPWGRISKDNTEHPVNMNLG